VGDVKLNYRVVAHLPLGLQPVAGTGQLKGMLTFRCTCGARLGAKLEMIRSVHVCPRCGTSLIVPELHAPAAGASGSDIGRSSVAPSPRFDPDFRESSGQLDAAGDPHGSSISDEEAAQVLEEAARRDDEDVDDSAVIPPPREQTPPASAAPEVRPAPARDARPAARVRPIPTPSHPADQVIDDTDRDIQGGLPRHVEHEHADHHAFDVMHDHAQPRAGSPLHFGEDEAALQPHQDHAAVERGELTFDAVTWWSSAAPVHASSPAQADLPAAPPRDLNQVLFSLHNPEEDPALDDAPADDSAADDALLDQQVQLEESVGELAPQRDMPSSTPAQAIVPQVEADAPDDAAPALSLDEPAQATDQEPADAITATAGDAADQEATAGDALESVSATVEPPETADQELSASITATAGDAADQESPATATAGDTHDPVSATVEPPDTAALGGDASTAAAAGDPPQIAGQSEPQQAALCGEEQAQAAALPLVSEGRSPQDSLADRQEASPASEADEPRRTLEARGDEDRTDPRHSPSPQPRLQARAEAMTQPAESDDARRIEPQQPAGHVMVAMEVQVQPHAAEAWVLLDAQPRREHDESVEVGPSAQATVLEAPGRALRSIWTRPAKGRLTHEPPHVALAHAPPRPDERTEQVTQQRWHRALDVPASVPWRQGAESPDAGRRVDAPLEAAAPAPPTVGHAETALLARSEPPAPLRAQEQVDDRRDDAIAPRLSSQAPPALVGQPSPEVAPAPAPGQARGDEAPDLDAQIPAAAPVEAAQLAPDRMQAGRHELPRAMAWWDAAVVPQTQAIILAWLESRRDLPAERPARSSHTQPHTRADEAHRQVRAMPQLAPAPQNHAAGDDHERQHVDEEDWWATPIVREHTGDEDMEA
jgi:hypothetical protein